MPRFHTKRLVVKAEQFTCNTVIEDVMFIKAETIDASRSRGITYDRPARWVFRSPDGHQDLTVGDWIVTYPYHHKVRYSNQLFLEIFEKPRRRSIFKR